jgi:hypothetical protein
VAESRKTVTIVFADVTGSTALGEQTDPEAMRRIMERCFEEILGYHLEQSYRHRASLGENAPDLARRAGEHLAAAAPELDGPGGRMMAQSRSPSARSRSSRRPGTSAVSPRPGDWCGRPNGDADD